MYSAKIYSRCRGPPLQALMSYYFHSPSLDYLIHAFYILIISQDWEFISERGRGRGKWPWPWDRRWKLLPLFEPPNYRMKWSENKKETMKKIVLESKPFAIWHRCSYRSFVWVASTLLGQMDGSCVPRLSSPQVTYCTLMEATYFRRWQGASIVKKGVSNFFPKRRYNFVDQNLTKTMHICRKQIKGFSFSLILPREMVWGTWSSIRTAWNRVVWTAVWKSDGGPKVDKPHTKVKLRWNFL